VTGGTGPQGTVRGDGPATVLVVTGPPPKWEPTSQVVTVPWTRNEQGALAGLKTTSYAENVVALARAHDAGADEAVFANTAGNLCEGTGTNVFVVIDSRIVTPPLSAGCLAGVTRELLLELDGVEVVEADVSMDVFAAVDEGFLTSSTRDVQPLASIDGRALTRCPGELTQAACEAFARLQNSNPDP
jgi:branched-chain amino acid aminotransferase